LRASTTFKENKIKNAKALSLIQGALTDELFPRIRNKKTAKGAWDILSREFRGDKKVRAVVCISFLVLQVTAEEERKRGGSCPGSPCFRGVSCGGAYTHAPPVAVAREADAPPLFLLFLSLCNTVSAVVGGSPCNYRFF
jgi:hypothetical protein